MYSSKLGLSPTPWKIHLKDEISMMKIKHIWLELIQTPSLWKAILHSLRLLETIFLVTLSKERKYVYAGVLWNSIFFHPVSDWGLTLPQVLKKKILTELLHYFFFFPLTARPMQVSWDIFRIWEAFKDFTDVHHYTMRQFLTLFYAQKNDVYKQSLHN